MGKSKIEGLEKVLKNLNKEIEKIELRALTGLVRAGIIVLYDVETKKPLTPVDLGNLRASRFLVASDGGIHFGESPTFINGEGKEKRLAGKLKTGHQSLIAEAGSLIETSKNPVVMLGFSAFYSAAVHEKIDAKFQRPGAGAKFLEKALDRNQERILQVIRKEARVKQ